MTPKVYLACDSSAVIGVQLGSSVFELTLEEAMGLRDEIVDVLKLPRCVDCGQLMPKDENWPSVTAVDDSCCTDLCCWHCHGIRMRNEWVDGGNLSVEGK